MNDPGNDIINFDRPSPENVSRFCWLQRKYFSPVYYGMENIEDNTPHMYIGNHTIHGVLDAPLLFDELYRKKGVFLRGMADHGHFSIPGWRNLITKAGGVPGTRENARKLLEAGEDLVITPGGGREVCKRKGEAYKLIWKKRLGFVRLAVEFGYPIMPFAMVGAESAYSIIFDRDDIMNSFLGKALEKRGTLENSAFKDGENIPPIVRGLGLTILPRPERLYFSFGKPVETSSFKGLKDDEEVLFAIREVVADSINNQIRDMLVLREQDTEPGYIRRFLNSL